MTSAAMAPVRSATEDWVRGLQRTAAITPVSTRTLAVAIDEMAARFPNKAALVGEGYSLSYAELADRTRLYAGWAQRQGLRAGDTVALVMANSPDYAAIWIGLSRLGIVTALINTQLVGIGLRHCIGLASSQHIIVDAEHLSAVEDAIGTTPRVWIHGIERNQPRSLEGALTASDGDAASTVKLADQALLIYTSGTTGLPKAARVSHYRIMMWSEWFAGIMNAGVEDRLYNCLPMYHSIGGVVAIGSMLVSGGAVIVRDGFSASRFWGDVVTSGATIFQYIGELCRYLAMAPDEAASRSHRLRLCCGNGLRPDIWETFEHRFDIPRIIEFYAATEGSFSLFNLEGRPGAIGRVPRFMAHRSPVAIVRYDHTNQAPARGPAGFCVRCEVDEAGEAIGLVAAEAKNLATRFEGYTSAAESETKMLRDVFAQGDAWFRTGDLMRRDAQGFFYFVDRIGDTFRWKGENVATAEVANILSACPGVREAAVYGVEIPFADGRAGMAALVVTRDFTIDTFLGHVEMHLPKYARPVVVRLVSALGTTGTFKVQKSNLIREGYDPNAIEDPLYLLHDGRYVALDRDVHRQITEGAIRL